MKRDDFPNSIIIDALNANDGFIKHTAKTLIAHDGKPVSRTQLNAWIYGDKKANPPKPPDEELIEAVYQARQGLIDDGESELAKNVREGKEASVFFLLKTLGKDRGYVERQENAIFVEQQLFDDDEDDDEGFFDEDDNQDD